MRYAYVTPRVAPVVSDAVITAREELRTAIKNGSVRDIDKAAEHLESVDRVARARRASAHSLRRVTAALESADLPWNRFLSLVEGFRKP